MKTLFLFLFTAIVSNSYAEQIIEHGTNSSMGFFCIAVITMITAITAGVGYLLVNHFKQRQKEANDI